MSRTKVKFDSHAHRLRSPQMRSKLLDGVCSTSVRDEALGVLYHLIPVARPQTHYNRPHAIATASGLI